MALTFDNVIESVFGDRRVVVSKVTLDSSYPTGGESIDVNDLGLEEAEAVLTSATENGYVPAWDYTNAKLQMFEAGADGAALDEVGDTTDLSAEVVTVVFLGH